MKLKVIIINIATILFATIIAGFCGYLIFGTINQAIGMGISGAIGSIGMFIFLFLYGHYKNK